MNIDVLLKIIILKAFVDSIDPPVSGESIALGIIRGDKIPPLLDGWGEKERGN
ncbi:hypothetical protein ACFLWU_03950 [Chloroflexota bacterium]